METSTHDLGEVVFQRSAGKALKIFVGLAFAGTMLAVVGLSVGGVFAALEIQNEGAPQMRGAGFLLLCSGTMIVLCGLFWLLLRSRANSVFVAFQYGVAVLKPRHTVRLRYDAIDTMLCKSTQLYVNGIYMNTGYAVILTGTDDGRPVNIRWGFQTRSEDLQLDLFSQMAARYIAKRMLQRVMNGEMVTWTKNLALSMNGLVINTRKDPVTIPFNTIADAGVVMGKLEVALVNDTKPSVKEDSHQQGFHAGFYAFGSLMTASGVMGLIGVEQLPWFEAGYSLEQ